MNQQPAIVERAFDAPVEKVWKAITDKDQMKQWYFDVAEFKTEEGFCFEFMGGPSPEKQYHHLCEVIEVIPLKRLMYSWRYEGYAGNSFVSFDLSGSGKQTILKLTHSGLDSFPEDNPDLARENFVKGWNEIVNHNLRKHLEGNN